MACRTAVVGLDRENKGKTRQTCGGDLGRWRPSKAGKSAASDLTAANPLTLVRISVSLMEGQLGQFISITRSVFSAYQWLLDQVAGDVTYLLTPYVKAEWRFHKKGQRENASVAVVLLRPPPVDLGPLFSVSGVAPDQQPLWCGPQQHSPAPIRHVAWCYRRGTAVILIRAQFRTKANDANDERLVEILVQQFHAA